MEVSVTRASNSRSGLRGVTRNCHRNERCRKRLRCGHFRTESATAARPNSSPSSCLMNTRYRRLGCLLCDENFGRALMPSPTTWIKLNAIQLADGFGTNSRHRFVNQKLCRPFPTLARTAVRTEIEPLCVCLSSPELLVLERSILHPVIYVYFFAHFAR